MPVQAVVLVGGYGTRLRPLTRTTPKQMLPVGNRPMIERVLAHLAEHGVRAATLALSYRPEAFQTAYPNGCCAGVRLHYAIEPEPLDTAGAIRFAALDSGIHDRFLVLNGDILTDLDITELIATHHRKGAEGTIALHRVDDPSAYGVVPTDVNDRVTAFIEKPPPGQAPTDRINGGTYVLEPSVLDRISPERRVNVEKEIFPSMVADGSLYAMDSHSYWIDAGTPTTYLAANLDLLSGRRGAPEDGIHPDAEVRGRVDRVWLGAHSTVAAEAVVERSVVLARATISHGAVVRDAIIGSGVRLGAGAVVDAGSVIGDGVDVPAGARLSGARIPEES